MAELQSRKAGNPKTTGSFESREKFETFIVEYAVKCVPVKIISSAAGCSSITVYKILKKLGVKGNLNKLVAMKSEMERVYQIENKHLRRENKKLLAKLEALRREWPTEDRMDIIGLNGNTGEHYAKIKSHTLEK